MTLAHHLLAEARHYRLVGWRDMAAHYLTRAGDARRAMTMENA